MSAVCTLEFTFSSYFINLHFKPYSNRSLILIKYHKINLKPDNSNLMKHSDINLQTQMHWSNHLTHNGLMCQVDMSKSSTGAPLT
jgi:hypothetical protein